MNRSLVCRFVLPRIGCTFRCLNFKSILCSVLLAFSILHQGDIKPIIAYQVYRVNLVVGIGGQMVHLHHFAEVEMLKLKVYNIRCTLQGYSELLKGCCSRNQFTACIVQSLKVVRQTANGQHLVVSEIEFIGQRHPIAANQCGSLGSFGKE